MLKLTEAVCVRSYRDLQAPLTMFEVFKQDMDEVIMLVNYYLERGEDKETETPQKSGKGNKREERIRVNDKTATNGWY